MVDDMGMTNEQYNQYVQTKTPPSNMAKNCIKALYRMETSKSVSSKTQARTQEMQMRMLVYHLMTLQSMVLLLVCLAQVKRIFH